MAKRSTKRTNVPVEKAPVALKQTMSKPISSYTDPEHLRTLMQNAKRMGREDIWRQAFDQLCSLEGATQTDPLDRAFYSTLAAYEQLLTQKNGRATRASRTRLKLKRSPTSQPLFSSALSSTAKGPLSASTAASAIFGSFTPLGLPRR